jgi:hypothetical protein
MLRIGLTSTANRSMQFRVLTLKTNVFTTKNKNCKIANKIVVNKTKTGFLNHDKFLIKFLVKYS